MKLKIKKLIPDLDLRYHSDGASGIDVPIKEDTFINDGSCVIIKCGFCVEMPEAYEGQIRPRSSWSSVGVEVCLGTIDSDYRGEICVTVKYNRPKYNNPFGLNDCITQSTVLLNKGERIAQLVIAPVQRCEIEFVDELSETRRGCGGFGSTGK